MLGNASIAAPSSTARFRIIAERVWLPEAPRLEPRGKEVTHIAELGPVREVAKKQVSSVGVLRQGFPELLPTLRRDLLPLFSLQGESVTGMHLL